MDTPGTILRREREARGILLKEIASITRIPVSALRNLEEDRFDQFPAEVFVKGFLRNYARELQIAVDDVLLAYQALRHQQVRQDVSIIGEPRKRDASPMRREAAPIQVPVGRKPPKKAAPAPAPRPEVEAVSPLVLGAADVERDGASSVDSSQRTFRYAYLVVLLVVFTSLGLSVAFAGRGEAEENGLRRARPVLDDSDKGSRWLMSDQKLTTTRTSIGAIGEVDTPATTTRSLDEVDDATADDATATTDDAAVDSDGEFDFTLTDEPARGVDDTAAAPERRTPADDWSRPAFPQDDHE